MKVLFSLALLSAFLAFPVQAATVKDKDNLGRPRVSTTEAISSITASGEAGVVFQVPDWDLFFNLGGTGTEEDTDQERAFLGFGAYVYVADNAALGVQVSRPNLAIPEVWAVTPKAKLYMFRDPFDSWTRGILFSPLSWNIATGENDALQGGAFSINPTFSGFAEWPIGWGSITVDLGLEYVFTEFSQDVPDKAIPQGGLTLSWWFVR